MGPTVPTEIIEAARCGDSADIERLLEAVWVDAYRLARAIVDHAQSAEDAAQEACVIMSRSIATLRDPGAFRTWFYRIVVREALKQKKATGLVSDVGVDSTYRDDPSGSLDLWRALATLPDGLRAVTVLHYFEALPCREIAAVFHIPEATVRFRLMTARRRLQPLLQEHDAPAHAKGKATYAL